MLQPCCARTARPLKGPMTGWLGGRSSTRSARPSERKEPPRTRELRLERMSDAEFAALGAPASVQKLRPTPGCRAPGQRSSLVRFSGLVDRSSADDSDQKFYERKDQHEAISASGSAVPRLSSLWQGEGRAARLSGGQSDGARPATHQPAHRTVGLSGRTDVLFAIAAALICASAAKWVSAPCLGDAAGRLLAPIHKFLSWSNKSLAQTQTICWVQCYATRIRVV